jgi:hypothetical protein
MERRSGLRKAMSMDVVVDSHRGNCVRGKIDNVGFGGLYLQIDTGELSKNAPVELAVVLHQESGPRLYRMHAFVARITPNGAGLTFDEYDVAAFRALVILLLAQRAGAAGQQVTGKVSFSNSSGSDAAATPEDTRDKAAIAAGSFVPMSQQPAPAQA